MKPGNFAKLATLVVFLFFYIPIIIVILFSFNSSKSPVWTGGSLIWYKKLFTESTHIWATFWNSIIVATVSSLIASILGTFGAIGIYLGSKKFGKIVYSTTYIPFIIPDIIIGVSLLVFFTTLGIPLSLVTVIIAHITFSIPYTILIILTRLQDFDKSIIEAAYDLGASRSIVIRKVLVPIALPGVIAAFFMSFTLSIDDFVVTFFVAGPSSTTLPLQIFSMIRFGISPVINAISTLLLVGTVFISYLLRRYVKYIM